MKTIAKSLVFCLVFLLMISSVGFAQTLFYDGQAHEYNDVITLKVNGEVLQTDVPPVIIRDRTMVPARGIFEKFGAKLEWDNALREVQILSVGVEIRLKIDSNIALINGREETLDVPAKIVNDRTMIPVRFVSEKLGMTVGWDGATRTVSMDQICDYEILSVTYSEPRSQLTVTADHPITGVEESTVVSKGINRLILDFANAKMATSVGRLAVNRFGLTEIRYSQYKLIPLAGRIVLEMEDEYPYRISYSEDRQKLYLDLTLEEEDPSEPPEEPSVPVVEPTEEPYLPPQVSFEEMPILDDRAKNKLVVIDPGHGGKDVGAVGHDEEGEPVYEKDLNLSIALKANQLLKAAGVTTYMTRSSDVAVDLYERPEIGNQLNAALFLSVHNNSFINSEANGTTVLYFPDGNPTAKQPMTSHRFADILQEELVYALDRYDRGLTDGREMVVIRKAIAPSVITELAFVSNEEEIALLQDNAFQDRAALALCRGVIRALNEMVQ